MATLLWSLAEWIWSPVPLSVTEQPPNVSHGITSLDRRAAVDDVIERLGKSAAFAATQVTDSAPRPPTVTAPPPPLAIKLTGTILGAVRFAIVEGFEPGSPPRAVTEGERIGELMVRRVYPNRITILGPDSTFEVFLDEFGKGKL